MWPWKPGLEPQYRHCFCNLKTRSIFYPLMPIFHCLPHFANCMISFVFSSRLLLDLRFRREMHSTLTTLTANSASLPTCKTNTSSKVLQGPSLLICSTSLREIEFASLRDKKRKDNQQYQFGYYQINLFKQIKERTFNAIVIGFNGIKFLKLAIHFNL